MVTQLEYNRAVMYSNRILKRHEFGVIASVYDGRDAVHDSIVRVVEKKIEPTVDSIINEILNAIGTASYKHKKANPVLAEKNRIRNTEAKTAGRKSLANWYLHNQLRNGGYKENKKELKARLEGRRAGKKKYDLIDIRIPELPEGAIYLPMLKGYEHCIGYCITQDKILSCKKIGNKMNDHWTNIRIKNGVGRLSVYTKSVKIRPKKIYEKYLL